MGKYQINCEDCGCSLEIVLFGKTDKREWIIENGTHLCEECRAKRLQAQNARCAEANAAAGLPDLTGSERQVAWAENLRKKVADNGVEKLIGYEFQEAMAASMKADGISIEDMEKIVPDGEASLNALLKAAFENLLQESSSKVWIENRDKMGVAFAGFFYNFVKEKLTAAGK